MFCLNSKNSGAKIVYGALANRAVIRSDNQKLYLCYVVHSFEGMKRNLQCNSHNYKLVELHWRGDKERLHQLDSRRSQSSFLNDLCDVSRSPLFRLPVRVTRIQYKVETNPR